MLHRVETGGQQLDEKETNPVVPGEKGSYTTGQQPGMDEERPMSEQQTAWTHHDITIHGIRLHYVTAGPPDGQLIVLLHGFPEFWYAWRHQIPALAAAGYRVVAPDLRGYNASDRPRGVQPYHVEHLAADIKALITALDAERAIIAAHDWGGVIAWYLAMIAPERVAKLIILNAPHPARYGELLRRWPQLRKAWYVLFFQLPWLPEWLLSARDFRAMEKALRGTLVNRRAMTSEDIARHKDAMRQPYALTAALNYYRAAFRANLSGTLPAIRHITCPTLLIWGEQDRALALENTTGLDRRVANLRVTRIPKAGHAVQLDAPERVNALMLDFLGPA
jgi:pimeloyl-ACP methyl ester carboxylesterase